MTNRIEVLAFEPSASNYLLLNRNVEVNRASERVRAYCIALSGETRIDALNMQSTEFGGAMATFAETKDYAGEEFQPSFRQGAIGFSIDDFIAKFDPPFPNHLKIDVDGIEDKIVAGASKTLRDPRLRSVSIELEADRVEYTRSVIDRLTASGFVLASKRHAFMFEGTKFEHVYNYLFQRLRRPVGKQNAQADSLGRYMLSIPGDRHRRLSFCEGPSPALPDPSN